MKLFRTRLAPGLPRDWNERPVIGGKRRQHIGPSGWFVTGLCVGVLLVLLVIGAL